MGIVAFFIDYRRASELSVPVVTIHGPPSNKPFLIFNENGLEDLINQFGDLNRVSIK